MSLRSLLHDKLPPDKLALLPGGFEVIGDIAIINIPPALDDEKYVIAEAMSKHRKGVRTVLRKLNKINRPARTADFEILMGDRTITLHRENGCVFQLDVTRTFFSGKMYFERARIVQKVNDGENVLVLFAGVGPFLIPIKKRKNVNISGLDSNRESCIFLKKNLELNNIDANIFQGDALHTNNLFRIKFDRIIMPAPYGQDFFLNLAELTLKPGGYIHFYTFKKDFEIAHFRRLLEEKGWRIDRCRSCGNVAPRVKRYVFDMQRPVIASKDKAILIR